MSTGTLTIVATPIGNLADLSPRARQILVDVDRILAEDTRHSRRLLDHFNIDTPLESLHEHSRSEEIERFVDQMRQGLSAALISDAGTPTFSDPGTYLIRRAHQCGIRVRTAPGPCADIAALSMSGFPSTPSVMLGFPPSRAGERRRELERWRELPATLVIYEGPHRITACLEDLAETMGAARPALIARELTKVHEETIDGTLGSLASEFAQREVIRGEFVIVVAPPLDQSAPPVIDDEQLVASYQELLKQGLDPREARRRLRRETGLPRSELWRRLEARRNG